MTLKLNEYDEVYFGARKPHYSNYIEHITTQKSKEFFQKVLDKYPTLKTESILEIGAGIGQCAKQSKNTNWLCTDVSQWCYDNRVHEQFLKREALEILEDEGTDSYHTVISFGFLDCCTDDAAKAIVEEAKRVSKKQIHFIYSNGNPKDYNIKSVEEWQELLGDSVIIEKYG